MSAPNLNIMPNARAQPVEGAGRSLGDAEVEVWTAALDGQPDPVARRLESFLSADERTRARQFHFTRDRRRFELGRGILRALLGSYLRMPPDQVRFRYGPSGKPALADDGGEPLYFNLAHTEGLAVYAFTRVGEVGVDVERIRAVPEWKQIAAAQFPAGDRARLDAAAESDRPREFFRAWTREEARLKASGAGLGGEVAGSVRPGAFVIHVLASPADYMAALAVSPAARWLTQREWPPAEDSNPPPPFSPARRIPLTRFSDLGTDSL